MSPLLGVATICGVGLGLGLWSIMSVLPRFARPRLVVRVAPYLMDVSADAREIVSRRTIEPLPVIGALLAPSFAALRTRLGSVLGGNAEITVRLRQAGLDRTLESFRSRQLVASIGGAALGLVGAVVVGHAALSFLFVLAIGLVGAVAGVLACDKLLSRNASARLSRIEAELPTTLEFLTLSLSAGEGILDGIRRVSQISRGELAVELSRVVAETNTGVAFADALRAMAADIRLPPLTRCVEQVIGALDRGTPLAEVLRAQAHDSRELAKRGLLEEAGKKEVAMLFPLVFLILPATVVFAVFPAFAVLQLGS
ncbi:type II secretion system F family protein [soil metagenome]